MNVAQTGPPTVTTAWTVPEETEPRTSGDGRLRILIIEDHDDTRELATYAMSSIPGILRLLVGLACSPLRPGIKSVATK